MNQVTIRPASESDFEKMDEVQSAAARDLCSSAYEASLIEAWVGTPKPDRYRRGQKRGAQYHVLLKHRQIIAFGGISIERGSLDALFVDPCHAGKGMGSRMMEHLLEIAREAGVKRLLIESSLNAVSFYARYGFAEYGRSEMACGEGMSMEAVLMERMEE